MDYYKIGQRIRKIRKAHRLSQEELAERIDISVTHMSHIETGSTKLSLPVLVDLARVLEVRTDDLLNESGTDSISTALVDISTVLESCTVPQSRVIVDLVKAAKLSMDKYM